MRIGIITTFSFFCLLVWCISSCKSDNDSVRPVALECMYTHLTDMTNMLDTAKIGTSDGTFPLANAQALQVAAEELQKGISKGLAGMFVLQYEIDNYCLVAEKAMTEFRNSYQETLSPGTPAELKIFGIDGKGRIEFGADAAYGGGKTFTVEAWLKYDAGFFESGIGSFLSTFDGNQPNEGWMINFSGSNLRTTIGMGPQNGRVLEEGRAYPDNFGQWNHIVTVWDENIAEGQLKMYINGELFFSKTNDVKNDAGQLQNYMPNTRNLNMWAFQEPTDKSRCMTGFIKNFRMWNTAKSAGEIKSLMKSEVAGTESGLVCAWDFTSVPDNVAAIQDKTGKHTAKITGNHKWFKIK